MTNENDDGIFEGYGLPEEIEYDPLLNDDALVRHLRQNARYIGMAYGVDRSVVRAALVAALPPKHQERAVRLLGIGDTMFKAFPEGKTRRDRLSGVDTILDGVISLKNFAARAMMPGYSEAEPLIDAAARAAHQARVESRKNSKNVTTNENPHLGSSLEEFLKDEGQIEDSLKGVIEMLQNEVLRYQVGITKAIQDASNQQDLTKRLENLMAHKEAS